MYSELLIKAENSHITCYEMKIILPVS